MSRLGAAALLGTLAACGATTNTDTRRTGGADGPGTAGAGAAQSAGAAGEAVGGWRGGNGGATPAPCEGAPVYALAEGRMVAETEPRDVPACVAPVAAGQRALVESFEFLDDAAAELPAATRVRVTLIDSTPPCAAAIVFSTRATHVRFDPGEIVRATSRIGGTERRGRSTFALQGEDGQPIAASVSGGVEGDSDADLLDGIGPVTGLAAACTANTQVLAPFTLARSGESCAFAPSERRCCAFAGVAFEVGTRGAELVPGQALTDAIVGFVLVRSDRASTMSGSLCPEP